MVAPVGEYKADININLCIQLVRWDIGTRTMPADEKGRLWFNDALDRMSELCAVI